MGDWESRRVTVAGEMASAMERYAIEGGRGPEALSWKLGAGSWRLCNVQDWERGNGSASAVPEP